MILRAIPYRGCVVRILNPTTFVYASARVIARSGDASTIEEIRRNVVIIVKMIQASNLAQPGNVSDPVSAHSANGAVLVVCRHDRAETISTTQTTASAIFAPVAPIAQRDIRRDRRSHCARSSSNVARADRRESCSRTIDATAPAS